MLKGGDCQDSRVLRRLGAEAGSAADRGRLLVLAPALALIWLGLPSSVASARELTSGGRPAPAPVNVEMLVRNAVYNQLHDMRHPGRRYQYTHEEISSGSSTTTVEIQTAHGIVARLVRVNGHPPTEAECSKNRQQLERIISSPRFARQRLKNQQSDLERKEQLFEALPDAVLFSYAGTEEGSGAIKLNYRPNPAFRPRLRVGGVLQGLAGTMWVDPSSQQILKIDGHLVKTVSFGWGILAKLYPGGRFTMANTRLPNGAWQLAELDVSFQGVILFFKKLNVNMKEIYTSFEAVPENMTLGQAVERLSRIPVGCGKD